MEFSCEVTAKTTFNNGTRSSDPEHVYVIKGDLVHTNYELEGVYRKFEDVLDKLAELKEKYFIDFLEDEGLTDQGWSDHFDAGDFAYEVDGSIYPWFGYLVEKVEII